ncbi:MBL fold metallo-hydrolase [Dyadobacter luteus]|uniref:MBL fold metallo-hydrolase n=1 Tax=Dyadobacter luteus TaxID=2259619 RepID=A0A3D8YE42_9BACT|nr:MBL fold metallo-hydrolase [Dyadobacter luteus]REA62827.1 MBL fold metallo-hydrolase [Dyadobacter luteus]
MEITALSEGLFTVDRSKIFVPYNGQQASGPGGVLIGVTPFLISTGNEYILLDTGLGYEKDGKLQILQSLQDQGIQPEQITHVILSHLHKDHTGGSAGKTSGTSYQLTFPNAKYYLQKRELDFARQQTDNPSYHHPALNLLADHPQVVFLDDDAGQITGQVHFEVSSGHTPFHQTITIKDGEKTIFYGADELPQYSYLTNNFNYKNDFNGRQSMDLRTKWHTQAQQEHWTVLFCHAKQRSVAEL